MKVFKSRAFPNAWRVPEKDVRYPTHFFIEDAQLNKDGTYSVHGILYSKGYRKWKPELQIWEGWFYRRVARATGRVIL